MNMKTKTKLVVGGMLLAAVVSSFGQPAISTQPQDQTNFRTPAILSVVLPAPFLVSASSVNATDIGVCFSESMDLAGLDTALNYQVNGPSGPVPIRSVSLWPGQTSVVLHLSAPVTAAMAVNVAE